MILDWQILLSMGVFLMDSQIQNRKIVVNKISSTSSIVDLSKSCDRFEILHSDTIVNPSTPSTRIEISLTAENNPDFAIDSSKQASRSRLSINSEDVDSISDTVMEEVHGNSTSFVNSFISLMLIAKFLPVLFLLYVHLFDSRHRFNHM
ncbi:hypothetical protein L6452_27543 [Arctium lappa]|uniref:Uncharacterized protein n=1 Tax=Arctium lappa TaxID=4217 RepID=A0ACB8ZW92_ARCLA|nr:hypothetical protein L6452_27543 [Arctium lappa]